MPTKLADRLAELEREVADLKEVVKSTLVAGTGRKPAHDAWRKTVGAFEGSALFDEVVRLGRGWRRRQPKC